MTKDRITTPFGATSTADDVIAGWTCRASAIVTGASSGIGQETANVLFAVEAAKRWAGDRITANALNPGRIASTGLTRHVDTSAPPPQSFDPEGSTGVSVKDIPQGAATSVLLAASPPVEGVTGRYFEDCQEAEPYKPGVWRGVASYALDPDKGARL